MQAVVWVKKEIKETQVKEKKVTRKQSVTSEGRGKEAQDNRTQRECKGVEAKKKKTKRNI